MNSNKLKTIPIANRDPHLPHLSRQRAHAQESRTPFRPQSLDGPPPMTRTDPLAFASHLKSPRANASSATVTIAPTASRALDPYVAKTGPTLLQGRLRYDAGCDWTRLYRCSCQSALGCASRL
jgi:hypothetical protein